MARHTLSAVFSLTGEEPLMMRETVAVETPALFATCWILIFPGRSWATTGPEQHYYHNIS
jgi:hypothetical protein